MLVSREAGAHFVTMSQKQSSVQEEDTVRCLLRVSLRGPAAGRPDWTPWGKVRLQEQPGCRDLSRGGSRGSGPSATLETARTGHDRHSGEAEGAAAAGAQGPVLAPGGGESAGNGLLALTHPPQACHSFPRLPPRLPPHPAPGSAGSRGVADQPRSLDGCC